jgi:DegV family protein with EDD domain
MIGLVVDSNSQMPPELAERYGIAVVPLVIRVDGIEYYEGVDLDVDDFYRAWSDGRVPVVETSQPSPGAFAQAYQRVIDGGATQILSVHISETMSGTLNSARLAAQQVAVPVRLVDSGTASFGISCCAWAAADAIAEGVDLETAAAVAATRAGDLHTTFVAGAPRLMSRSGQASGIDVDATAENVTVFAMTGSDVSVLGTAADPDTAVEMMVDDALRWPPSHGDGLRIAIGTSDTSSEAFATTLTDRLTGHRSVAEVVQYRIGPSVGAYTGPATAGLFVF